MKRSNFLQKINFIFTIFLEFISRERNLLSNNANYTLIMFNFLVCVNFIMYFTLPYQSMEHWNNISRYLLLYSHLLSISSRVKL